MKTALRQSFASLVGWALLGASLAHAQQYISPEQARAVRQQSTSSAVRVAQQPSMAAQPGISAPRPGMSVNYQGQPYMQERMPTMAPPQAVPEGMSPTADTMAPIPQGAPMDEASVGFPGLSPNGQPMGTMPPPLNGVENGLWDGCEPGDGCAICGGGYCQPPLWFTEQGMRILGRTRAGRQTLASQFVQTTSPITGQQIVVERNVFTTRSANYDAAPGYYTTIGRYLGRDSQDRDQFLEFNYWGMNTWFSTAFIDGDRVTSAPTAGRTITFGNLFSPFPSEVIGFNRADTQNITLHSEMHNAELNLRLRPRGRQDQLVLQPNGRWRRECQPGTYCSYLVGLRYMTIGDGFIWNSRGSFDDSDAPGPTATNANYTVQTENDLLGFQVGTDMIFRRCKWSWGVHAKAGPFINFARNMEQIVSDGTDPNGFVVFNDRFNTYRQKVAFIGEVGFEANYKFTPTFAGRAMYDLMWIQGLALAPDQLQFTSTPENQIDTKGGMFAHGLTLALEWSW